MSFFRRFTKASLYWHLAHVGKLFKLSWLEIGFLRTLANIPQESESEKGYEALARARLSVLSPGRAALNMPGVASLLWHLSHLAGAWRLKKMSQQLLRSILNLSDRPGSTLEYKRLASIKLGSADLILEYLESCIKYSSESPTYFREILSLVNFAIQSGKSVSEIEKVLADKTKIDSGLEEGIATSLLNMALTLNFSWVNSDNDELSQFFKTAKTFSINAIEGSDPVDFLEGWNPWISGFCQDPSSPIGKINQPLASIAKTAWPALSTEASHLRKFRPQETEHRRIRLGFYFHSTMPMVAGMMQFLDPAVYETFFIHPDKWNPKGEALIWEASSEHRVQASDKSAMKSKEIIESLELDILICGPYHVSMWMTLLSRVAHLQMIMIEPAWTDGGGILDYYVSWRRAEPTKYSEFYSASVALLENPPYWIDRDPKSLERVSRARVRKLRKLVGASQRQRVYLCPSTIPKLSTELDYVIRGILERDPSAVFVLLRSEMVGAPMMMSRIKQSVGLDYRRIRTLSSLSKSDAHQLLRIADCVVDSFPLTGMSSSFDEIKLGVPVVTLKSQNPFGMWTSAIYEYVGVDGLVAKNKDDLIEQSVALAKNPRLRKRLANELQMKASKFLENNKAGQEFAEFIASAWERHLLGKSPQDWADAKWVERDHNS